MVLPLFSSRFCKLDCCIQSCSGGNSCENRFLGCQIFSGLESILIFYLDDFIVNAGIQSLRHETCADSLDFMRWSETPSDSTGEDAGSTATIFTSGFFFLNTHPFR